VFTNIPGPSAEIEMAGSKVLRCTASPPQGGQGVLAIGVISYNGHLVWTVTGTHASPRFIPSVC
jgi:diacylglycerol O-acyltransferase